MSTTESEVTRREREGRQRERGAGEARRDARHDPTMQVRAADLEPYVGLRYVTKLFRIIALFLLILLIAEVAVGLYQQGWEATLTLLPEATRLLVAAGLLWGAGDLAVLMIDIGHDVRATRILIGRQSAHQLPAHHRPGEHHRATDAAPAADEAPRGGGEE